MTEAIAALSTIPHAGIHSFPMDDELILFDERSKHLFRNNATAAVIWQGCEAGFSPLEIAAALSGPTCWESDQIAHDVEAVISQWQTAGLLEGSEQRASAINPVAVSEQPLSRLGFEDSALQRTKGGPEVAFRILDITFLLNLPSDSELQKVAPLLGHLSRPSIEKHDAALSIVRADDQYVLMHDGEAVDRCADTDGIAPMLHGNAVVIAYELSQGLIGLHAAAVFRRGKCMLLPAPSGSGKSTLTAALIGSGFALCADDLVMLTPAPVHLRPVPVAVGVKTGSWNLLAPYHPILTSLATHLRSDGKHVRYLVPPAKATVSPAAATDID